MPVPFEFVKKSQENPHVGKKNLQNWENTGLFWIGKQPVFGCKIGKIKVITPRYNTDFGYNIVML